MNVNEKLMLVFPTLEHKDAAWAYRQEHFDCGENVIHGDGGLDDANNYEEWLAHIENDIHTPRQNWVRSATYFGMVNNKIVGTINIRYELNDFLIKFGGHIGYGIRPSERRKGYATQMLALALNKCRELDIDKALITCDKNNIASAGTIQKNGGVLENELPENDGRITQRYWITLK